MRPGITGRRNYWRGFAAGAAAGSGAALAAMAAKQMLDSAARSRIIRIEKSIQIGRPLEEVFNAWASLDWLTRDTNLIQEIRVTGNRSYWTMQLNGKQVEWDAEIEQFIPNQAIGWKSVNGPRHSGRVTFGPLGNDTLLQTTMNYSQPGILLWPFARQRKWPLEHCVDRALRDFKASMEFEKHHEHKAPSGGDMGRQRATGTYGEGPEYTDPRFGGPTNSVD
ncbi:MAG TPA: hypothetical protein VG892_12455 [Terriglobales bacterium]|jgi:uncharacterized membrane protein|nr:hypothetical protein [Terriglobales bacterium]